MNSFLERASAFVSTSPALAGLPLMKEQILTQMAYSHESVRELMMEHVGINVDFSNFCIVVFTTLTVIFTAFIVSLSQKKGSEKKPPSEEIKEVKAEEAKEGYEATAVEEVTPAPAEEQQPTASIEEQPVAPSNPLDDSTGSISSQPIFFVNQLEELSPATERVNHDETTPVIVESQVEADDEEEEAPASPKAVRPELSDIASPAAKIGTPNQFISPRVSSRVKAQPERFSPRGKLLPTDQLLGKTTSRRTKSSAVASN